MYYSKRQLYALGEPLGESVTQRKAGGGMIYGGGGSAPAPSGPTNTTVTNTNIPDYAQPYVTNMLNAAQAQIYNPSMTGFNAYVPYSQNPSDYVAGFSPLQQQAQSTAANMQVPGQYGAASNQTMQDINQFGRLGRQMGQAGNQYNQAATNGSIGAYMNPYIQQSLAPQLQLLGQQTGIQSAAEQAAATSRGAFGGSREALANSLAQQNGQLAAQQAIAQGYNTAFGNAQQAQQFGANLGLQGQQAQAGALASQMGGANQLAGIGGQQLAAQQGIANMQNQYGGQQQGQQQQIINQAVQNYATAQQYPYMQLGQLNAMLRGLPMQQSSTSMYQAAPNAATQAAGLGIAGLGAAGMYNAATKVAKGGKVKAMAMGGSAVPMNMMSDQQLNQVQQNPASSPMAKINAQGLEQMHGYIKNNPQAGAMLSQPLPQQTAQAPMDRNGVGAIATPPNMTQMAGGGIIAFAEGDEVKSNEIPRGKKGELDLASILADRLSEKKSGKGTVSEAIKPYMEEQKSALAQQRSLLIPEFLTHLGVGMAQAKPGQPGSGFNQFATALGSSAENALNKSAQRMGDISALQKATGQSGLEAAKADQARRDALTQTMAQVYGTQEAKKIGLAQAAATRQAGIDAKMAALSAAAREKYSKTVGDAYRAIVQNNKNTFNFDANSPDVWNQARLEAWNNMAPDERTLVGLAKPDVQAAPVVPAPAGSAAPAAASAPVNVTVAGKTISFPTQAQANAFIASPQYKALAGQAAPITP